MIAAFSRTTAITLLALASLPALAWWGSSTKVTGSGTPRTEERPVAGFTAISVAIPGKVELVQGTRESLSITGDDNIVPLIEARVEGGSLKISLPRNTNLKTVVPLRLTLGARALESINIYGSGDVNAAALNAKDFTVSIYGSGDVNVAKLAADKLSIKIRGSGDVQLSGRTDVSDISIAGSGDVKLGMLDTKRTEVSIAGSGDAQVWAREKLDVTVAGSGDVRYFGDPAVGRTIMGSGSIKRLGAQPN